MRSAQHVQSFELLRGRLTSSGEVVAHAQGVGNDGKCRINHTAGHEEAPVHNVQVVHIISFGWAIGRAPTRAVVSAQFWISVK